MGQTAAGTIGGGGDGTVTVIDEKTVMSDSDELSLDDMFELLEQIIPEGYLVEIVGGNISMSPRRNAHYQNIRRMTRAIEDHFGLDVKLTSDVRIDFPGAKNGFCPDLAKLRDDADQDDAGRWRYQDVEFVAEVISKDTAANDYGPKKDVYAMAGVPVYLIVDPYSGECHLFTLREDRTYDDGRTVKFGNPVEMTDTVMGMVLPTDRFVRR
ncbi:Uma2 family endonuclease [Streptomyces sp. CT34]|uniref:Uma2 family endonuclease n=1 Tax=Streptomyces sp. CT34 TaxID=1553907 RepID=UPI000AF018AC